MRVGAPTVALLLALAWASAAQTVESPRPATQAREPEQGRPALDLLEAAVLADPDDLRRGTDYRMAVIQAGQYDRALAFFEKLAASHPRSANAFLNFGFAYVDKIPSAGAITQVILANTALTRFTRALELRESWLALYTRGNSYVYWPKVFGRAKLAVADLEAALRLQRAEPRKPYHARTFVSLGDAHWKMDDLPKARAIWSEGLRQFPGNEPLQARLSRQGEDLAVYIEDSLDPNRRVDTSLRELWAE
jgi:tetratricopeptide (TPR) repeat protein